MEKPPSFFRREDDVQPDLSVRLWHGVTIPFPNKQTKVVGNSLRPRNIDQFLLGLPLVFQPNKSKGLDATYHFSFTGAEGRTGHFKVSAV